MRTQTKTTEIANKGHKCLSKDKMSKDSLNGIFDAGGIPNESLPL